MIHTADKRIIRLDGLRVTQLVFDFRFAVIMWETKREMHLTIGAPFLLHTGHAVHELDPERSETLCPVLILLHKPADFFEATHQGSCRLRFEDGTEIQVPKHEEFESWEVSGSGELEDVQMLCSPHAGPPWHEE